MEGIRTFKGSWPWPWPWIRPYGIPSCITHRPLPIYQISFKSKKLFVDGRTYGRTDGHFSPSNIIRSTFGSRPNNMRLLWHDSRTSVQYVEERKITHTISHTVQTISTQSYTQSYIAVQFNVSTWRQVPTLALWHTAYGRIRQTGKVTGLWMLFWSMLYWGLHRTNGWPRFRNEYWVGLCAGNGTKGEQGSRKWP